MESFSGYPAQIAEVKEITGAAEAALPGLCGCLGQLHTDPVSEDTTFRQFPEICGQRYAVPVKGGKAHAQPAAI